MKNAPLLITALSLSCIPHFAIASSAEVTKLKTQIERLERTLEKVITTQESQASVSLKPKLMIESPDKRYSFGVDGFVQADVGWMDSETSDLANSTNIKRARVGLKGKLGNEIDYRVLTEFANNSNHIIDAFANYKGLKDVTLTAGQFREPFGLENMTPAKYWTHAERASLTALAPKRSLGAGVTWQHGAGHISAGMFGENMYKKRADDEGYGAAARATYIPYDEDGTLVHLGLSGRWRAPDAETNAIRFKENGLNSLTGAFVDTGAIRDVEHTVSVNPEFALIHDAFSLQGEYTHTTVTREGKPDLAFSGAYGEASYFLTGESRNYNRKKGTFGKIKPEVNFDLDKGGPGAWQLSYRFSHLDLNDADITGGELTNHTAGINWYPNPSTRISANVIRNETDRHAKLPDEKATIFMLRSQFEF